MDLEAEYNNSAKVPDAAAIREAWDRDAAAFRARQSHRELGLAYGPTPRQAMDIFWPGDGRDSPIAMFIHGGYWRMGTRDWNSHLANGLLAHGVAVALPSYDLCPNVTLAELVGQVRSAARFLHARHGRRLLVAGHSAGGHLAATLLATEPEAVAAAMPISGLFDLVPLTQTTVNDGIRLDEAEARRLSPLYMPRPAGRLHAIVGGTEGVEYTRQTRSIAEAWGGTWEAVPGANHFTIIAPLTEPDSAMTRTALGLVPA